MRRCPLVFIAASKFIVLASGNRHQSPAFFVHHRPRRLSAVRQRHSVAFVDNNNKHISGSLESIANNMASSSNDNDLQSDAAAYHDMVSAAVDFASVYEKNGVVTGEFTFAMYYCK